MGQSFYSPSSSSFKTTVVSSSGKSTTFVGGVAVGSSKSQSKGGGGVSTVNQQLADNSTQWNRELAASGADPDNMATWTPGMIASHQINNVLRSMNNISQDGNLSVQERSGGYVFGVPSRGGSQTVQAQTVAVPPSYIPTTQQAIDTNNHVTSQGAQTAQTGTVAAVNQDSGYYYPLRLPQNPQDVAISKASVSNVGNVLVLGVIVLIVLKVFSRGRR